MIFIGGKWRQKALLPVISSCSLMFCLLPAKAQTALPGWGPYVNVQTGWAAGSATSGFLGTAAAGVRYRRWGLGLASGIDNEGLTSAPFMLDLRWALLPGRSHTLEFFSQQGWNKITQAAQDWPIRTTYSNGPFWYGGVSYKLFSTSRTTGFSLSAGASYKQYGIHPVYEYFDVPGTPGPEMLRPEPNPPSVIHREWRGVLTLGWGWR